MKRFLKAVWNWHGWIGKFFTIFCVACLIAGVVGLAFGFTKCKQHDEIIYTNIFLNEKFDLHNSNYEVTVLEAKTIDQTTILNKKGDKEKLSGHFVDATIKIFQKSDSKEKIHKFDRNDFKLKGHTGVYLPLNDIASIVGWDMIDLHWDKRDNGFVISSADISTEKAIADYTYVGKAISPGEEINFHVFLPISNKNYNVETSVMILEFDFLFGGIWSERKRGEDVILLPRPDNLKAQKHYV